MNKIKTTYGDIFRPEGACNDHYPNLVRSDWLGQIVELQQAAMRSFHEAEQAYANRTHPSPGYGGRRRAIILTGSIRSCERQAELYASDPKRYAPPDLSLHPRALAIDVSMAQSNLSIINQVLRARGWKQARPDEPWHYSYWVTG